MRHLARHLALLACVAVTSSVTDASARRRSDDRDDRVEEADEDRPKKKRKKKSRSKAKRAKQKKAEDDAVEAAERPKRKRRKSKRERLAFRFEDDVSEDDRPVKVRKRSAAPTRDWRAAIGPYLWLSSVDADISLGSETLSAGVDFMDITRHARYGVPVQAEVSYGRFAVYSDFMYGVVDLQGEKEVGPFNIAVAGTARSLLVDGFAGYTVVGSADSLIAVEPRVGIRYQRTVVNGTGTLGGSEMLEVDGDTQMPQVMIDSSADALVGARVELRPSPWLQLAGMFDRRVFGESASSWSATAEVTARIKTRAAISVGYRTMTNDSGSVSLRMHGPRLAIQLTF